MQHFKMAEDVRMLLESLFYKGYEYQEILYMLRNQHSIISLITHSGKTEVEQPSQKCGGV